MHANKVRLRFWRWSELNDQLCVPCTWMLHIFTTDDASNYEVSIGVSDPFGNYYGTFGENMSFRLTALLVMRH